MGFGRASTNEGMVVVNASGHLAYANSLQMEPRRVNAAANVKGVMKGADGEPTGEFHETATTLVFDEHSVFAGDFERVVGDGAELLRHAGVTSASDRAPFTAGDYFEHYERTANELDSPVRVFYSPNLSGTTRGFPDEELIEQRANLR